MLKLTSEAGLLLSRDVVRHDAAPTARRQPASRSTIGDDLHKQLYDIDKKTKLPEIRRRYYKPKNNAYMPVEFSAAAYRFGHSQIRDRYALNNGMERPLFEPGDSPAPNDLRGSRHVPAGAEVDWSLFFSINGSRPQLTRLIDTHLSPSLFDLPNRAADEPQPLPLLNLLRGQQLHLPSGQSVATHVGADVLTAQELRGPEQAPVPEPTPLWYQCPISGVTGPAVQLVVDGVRRSSKVIAKALRAGFQRMAQRALPRPVGSSARVAR